MAASPFIEDGTKVFGMMLTLNALAVLVVQYPIVHIAKRFSPILSLIAGNVLISGSLFSLSFFHDLWSIVLIIIVFTIGEVLLFSMMDLLVDRIARPELKGTYFGAIGFTQLGSVIGPWAGECCWTPLERKSRFSLLQSCLLSLFAAFLSWWQPSGSSK